MHEEAVQMSLGKGGAPAYMAPEILEGAEQWSFPGDVYAYAIMFWEVLTGRRWEKPEFKIAKVTDHDDEGPGRPPLAAIPKQEHRTLLTRMWTWEIANRPTFGGIVEVLERREYWLPDTAGASSSATLMASN
jgi:serine/threonine protein kinase